MIRIESRDNRALKNAIKLSSKKARDKENAFLIEGYKVVKEAAMSGLTLRQLFISDAAAERMPDAISFGNRGIEPECSAAGGGPGPDEVCGAAVYSLPDGLFRAIASEQNPDGVAAVATRPAVSSDRFIQSVDSGDNILVLDRLQDPGNLGTIVRTCEGAGFTGIISITGTSDLFGPKVVRAAAGTLFRVPIACLSEDDAISLVRSMGKKLVVSLPSGGTDYREAYLKKDIALVIGNEGSGISDNIIRNADIGVSIPMRGKLESLNASIAAALIMYETLE